MKWDGRDNAGKPVKAGKYTVVVEASREHGGYTIERHELDFNGKPQQATMQAGYPESTIVGIGFTLLVCTLLYLIPRTSIFGAVLLTGYLGGAVATNVRAEMGTFNIVAPVIFACVAWGGLWLRDRRLEQLLAGK